MMTLLLILACQKPPPELLSFTFSRFDCVQACIGEQPMKVPAEYWGEIKTPEEDYYGFSYAGMSLLALQWDVWGAEQATLDPMWGVQDPACDLHSVGEMHDWPACASPLPAYPPSEDCY